MKIQKLSHEDLALYHQDVKEESHAFNCSYRDNTFMAWWPGVIKTYKISVPLGNKRYCPPHLFAKRFSRLLCHGE